MSMATAPIMTTWTRRRGILASSLALRSAAPGGEIGLDAVRPEAGENIIFSPPA
jgi:hypothetical protein